MKIVLDILINLHLYKALENIEFVEGCSPSNAKWLFLATLRNFSPQYSGHTPYRMPEIITDQPSAILYLTDVDLIIDILTVLFFTIYEKGI